MITSTSAPTAGRTAERPAIRSLRLDVHDRPFIVIWETTRACQLVCRHCRADAVHHRHPLELTTEEGFALVDDLAGLGAPRPILVLTGGDPFERPDLAELVRHGSDSGLSVALSPSVTPRLTRDVLADLRGAGASAVSLSLDGATAATHDGFRGVDGVWRRTLDAARTVRELGFRLQINTTVTRSTVAELPDVLHRVHELGAGLWSVFFLVPTGRGRELEPLDASEVEQVLHWLHEVSGVVAVKTTEAPHFRRVVLERTAAGGATIGNGAADVPALGELHEQLRRGTAAHFPDLGAGDGTGRRRPPLDVNAGRGFVFVDHLGDVYPSGFLPERVGSVREAPLSTIYRTAPLLRALRDPERLGGRCGTCEYRQVCGGSRSHAHAVSGDPLGEDPTCVHPG